MGTSIVAVPKDFRKRLEALNRGALPTPVPRPDIEPAKPSPASTKPPVVYGRDPLAGKRKRRRPNIPPGTPVNLELACDGAVVDTPEHGRAYVVETPLASMEGGWHKLSSDFAEILRDDASGMRHRLSLACGIERVDLEDIIFMDIETTGLSSSPLFLIGVMVWRDDGLVVRQFFARNYAEEAAVVKMYHDIAAQRGLLVSFNGKSFDVPFIRTRAAANVAPFQMPAAHFDLLHVSRRVWKGDLPNCKLQTLESLICKRPRKGDIPGAEIPEAYHAYVRTENAVRMVEVLKHNLLDLVTLADLMTRLPKVK